VAVTPQPGNQPAKTPASSSSLYIKSCRKKSRFSLANKKGTTVSRRPFLTCRSKIGLLVALFASSRPFFHIGVAAFASLVCEVLAKAFNLAGSLLMTLLAVTYGCLVSLVIELYAPFELHYIRTEGSSCKGNNKQCHYGFFHLDLLPVSFR
jgi:hypothetical protein